MGRDNRAAYDGIVILGAPRSGTTLLRRLLNAHPRIASPAETGLLGASGRFLHEEPFGAGLSVGVVPGLAYSGIEESEILSRLRELAFGFLGDLATQQGKTFWAEKTAFDSFHLDEIERICADRVRYVSIFRHGLDVVCSIDELCRKMETYVSELHEYIRRYNRPFDAFAHAWLDITGRMLKLAADRPAQCVQLRYEALIGDPERELRRIFAFLGEPTDVDELLRRAFATTDPGGLGDWKTYQLSALSGQSIGRWRSLERLTRQHLAGLLNPRLRELGYDALPEGRELSAEESRRRMQLGLLAAGMKKKSTGSDRGSGGDGGA